MKEIPLEKGVLVYDHDKWSGQLYHHGDKKMNIGSYKTKEEALEVYESLAKVIGG